MENTNSNSITIEEPEVLPTRETCYYCKEYHSITNCDHPQLREFEIISAIVYNSVSSHEEFVSWLYEKVFNNPSALFAFMGFALRNCGCIRGSTVQECIDKFIIYMSNTYTMGNSQEQTIEPIGNYTVREMTVATWMTNIRQTVRNSEQHTPEKIKLTVVTDIKHHTDEVEQQHCECSICWEKKEYKQFVGFICKHEFCKECVLGILETKTSRDEFNCSLCRQKIEFMAFHSEETHNEFAEYLS